MYLKDAEVSSSFKNRKTVKNKGDSICLGLSDSHVADKNWNDFWITNNFCHKFSEEKHSFDLSKLWRKDEDV